MDEWKDEDLRRSGLVFVDDSDPGYRLTRLGFSAGLYVDKNHNSVCVCPVK